MRNAICELPDTHYTEFIKVAKGEPGYDDANWAITVEEYPARYILKDGKYVPN